MFRQVDEAGFEQTQQTAAGHTAQQIQRGVHGAGGGGILGGGCFVAEKRDALQAEFIPQCAKIPAVSRQMTAMRL